MKILFAAALILITANVHVAHAIDYDKLGGECKVQYSVYANASMPKAWAQTPSGNCGWAGNAYSIQQAEMKAMRYCGQDDCVVVDSLED